MSAEQVQLQEVAVCFGGQLMRGNRAQKVNASNYQAFDSPTYHKLALLGVEVDWQARYLLQVQSMWHPHGMQGLWVDSGMGRAGSIVNVRERRRRRILHASASQQV